MVEIGGCECGSRLVIYTYTRWAVIRSYDVNFSQFIGFEEGGNREDLSVLKEELRELLLRVSLRGKETATWTRKHSCQ